MASFASCLGRSMATTALILLAAATPPTTGKFAKVMFTEATPLATNAAMIDRMYGPMDAEKVARANDATALAAIPVDPKAENFGMYVPANKPAKGYGLIVWISPMDEAGMPRGWPDTLEERGIIYVTAARSGNGQSPLGRRVPLALVAAANAMRDYNIDPARVWIAGFSGGARMAERMAVAYPDIFTGAIVDGSADMLGSREIPLPLPANFDRLVERSAFVFSNGRMDDHNVKAARRAISSLEDHCVTRVWSEVRQGEGHEMMGGRSLAKAIDFLDREREPPSAANLQCRDALKEQATRASEESKGLARAGDARAEDASAAADRKFGWLAFPR
jgi:pimeloyl-ACP methyl ester carboxylesterase